MNRKNSYSYSSRLLVDLEYPIFPPAAATLNLFNFLEHFFRKILLVDFVGFKPLTNHIAI